MTAIMITSAFGISAGAYDDCTFEATMADGSAGTVTVKDGGLSYDIVFTVPTSPFDFPEAIDPTHFTAILTQIMTIPIASP